jgi:hypothetical protein
MPRRHPSIPATRQEYSRIEFIAAGIELEEKQSYLNDAACSEGKKEWRNKDKQARFEEMIMPNLDAAYNLARCRTRCFDVFWPKTDAVAWRPYRFRIFGMASKLIYRWPDACGHANRTAASNSK